MIFNIEWRSCKGMGWLASHEHSLLPFSTPQSYAVLSPESKATEAAKNKERLGECHDIVWCRTILRFAPSLWAWRINECHSMLVKILPTSTTVNDLIGGARRRFRWPIAYIKGTQTRLADALSAPTHTSALFTF
jgi:hypothetical protein